ncbi:MAG: hypothetical protein KDA81_06225 [Planctomycetaceae bacterium]|nr:hypothetical protein [Planctomycetaceae bacterium]
MKKDVFNEWLRRRVEFSRKVTIGGCAAMAALSVVLFIVQGGILFVLLRWGYGLSIALLALVGIFGGMGVFTWMTAPRTLRDEEHTVSIDGRDVAIRIAPTMASAWTFALGSLDSDQSIPERIFGMAMLVPRMAWTSLYVFKRIEQIQQIDVPECGKVLRMVLKKAERVEVADIADKFTSMDLPGILRQVSLIDGVVFLTRHGVGISLANRFRDDLEKQISDISDEPPTSPFDQ